MDRDSSPQCYSRRAQFCLPESLTTYFPLSKWEPSLASRVPCISTLVTTTQTHQAQTQGATWRHFPQIDCLQKRPLRKEHGGHLFRSSSGMRTLPQPASVPRRTRLRRGHAAARAPSHFRRAFVRVVFQGSHTGKHCRDTPAPLHLREAFRTPTHLPSSRTAASKLFPRNSQVRPHVYRGHFLTTPSLLTLPVTQHQKHACSGTGNLDTLDKLPRGLPPGARHQSSTRRS